MDQNHVVLDQLPIEQMFLKCQPKQSNNNTNSKAKRSLKQRSSDGQGRQARSRVQQHSRRELEARRNKMISSDSQRDWNSSDSSDTNRGESKGFKRNNALSTSKSSQFQSSSAQTPSPGPSSVRKSTKYTASQSLLQQLQRSQSSHNNSLQNNTDQAAGKDPSSLVANSPSSTNQAETRSVPAVRENNRGIIKSASTFAFTTESNLASKSPEQPQIASSNHKNTQLIPTKSFEDSASGGGNLVPQATNKQSSIGDGLIKNADAQSDLPNDNELISGSNDNNNVESSPRYRPKAAPRSSISSLSSGSGQSGNNFASVSNYDNNNNTRSQLQFNNSKSVDIPSEAGNGGYTNNNNNAGKSQRDYSSLASANNTFYRSTNSRQQRQQKTADRDSYDENAAKSNSVITSDLISIHEPTNNISLDKPDKSSPFEGINSSKRSLESCQDENPIDRKDEENYINLLIYDNNSQQLQKIQTVQSQSSSSLVENKQPNHSKAARYRPRTNRSTNGHETRRSESNQDLDVDVPKEHTSLLLELDETQNEIETGQISSSCHTSESQHRNTLISAQDFNVDQIEVGQSPTRLQSRDKPDSSSNITSIHHQTSQQLLSSDANDNDESIVRNDASTEELCSASDNSENLTKCLSARLQTIKNQEIETTNPVVQQPELEVSPAKPLVHKLQTASIGTLQTVDEKAEIQQEETDSLDSNKAKINHVSDNIMPASPSTKLVPPGYPQRIRPQSGPIEDQSKISHASVSPSVRETKPVLEQKHSTFESRAKETTNSGKSTSQRVVKFEDESLVNITDEQQSTTPKGAREKSFSPSLSGVGGRKMDAHSLQMPIIDEAQIESELDVSKTVENQTESSTDRSGMLLRQSKHSQGNNMIRDTKSEDVIRATKNEPRDPDCLQQSQRESCEKKSAAEDSYHHERPDMDSHLTPDTQMQPPSDPTSDSSGANGSPHLAANNMAASNLRLHKLPNETSHFSVVRTGANLAPASSNNSVPSRSSSIQFNKLSDGESGPEELANNLGARQTNSSGRNYVPNKRCDLASSTMYTGSSVAGLSMNRNSNSNSSNSMKNDDDSLPSTKTALIFPRLDEGLSSEAESCEDDIEDDDERAMEADVDADDDDDDDELDEDADNDAPLERAFQVLQMGQSSADCFLREQQNRAQNRLLNSQQQSLVNTNPSSDQPELNHQLKTTPSTYGNYLGQDSLDNSDLKSMSSYNQNGQSNYWMGANNQQQLSMSSSQPSGSNRNPSASGGSGSAGNSNHNDNSLSKTNNSNSFNRGENKTTSRLSSDTDNETDRLLGSQRNDQLKCNEVGGNNSSTDLQPVSNAIKQNANSSREVLIEGVLFPVKYLGSTHTDCEGRSEKEDRIHQAEMAVHEVKFRNGESQMAIEVQLFISTEKIMVLDDKNERVMMDHSLRTISYIADIGDAIVLIVRKKSSSSNATSETGRPVSKISCHVFESSESHTITKSISQAFQVAYTELLKANGTGDGSGYLPRELDYQEVLNSQEMSTDELEMFARKENQREVIVPKNKGEILGLSIVESGWGSVLPTVVIANLKPDGPAYRCKKLSIGDQILSVNGISLVGLPLAECQEILRKTKKQRVARLSVVPCPITVEVKIKRPDTKYQLGFSVQNGVICSLLRGGIAERGGVRVGHRIMSINGTTVVGVPHEKIVTLLASSVGEIRMKTCLTSLYRLILGEENPVHF